jgi:hypothetical protein
LGNLARWGEFAGGVPGKDGNGKIFVEIREIYDIMDNEIMRT